MIQTWKEKAEYTVTRVQLQIRSLCKKARSERGDTNFISILIILGIVVTLAAIFIGFKDRIIAWVENMISGSGIGF